MSDDEFDDDYIVCSSAVESTTNSKVAIKKLARPFQSAVHAKRTYRELRMLKHMDHENVCTVVFSLKCLVHFGFVFYSEIYVLRTLIFFKM